MIKKIKIKNKYLCEYIALPDINPDMILQCINKPELFFELDGFFSFIIKNLNTNELIMVTDSFSSYKIYYKLDVPKASFRIFKSNNLSEKGVRYYFKYRFIPAPYSFYKDVFSVPPATYLKIRGSKIISQKTACFEYNKRHITENEFDYFINNKISTFLKKLSDEEAGVFLSGGMDSSAITYFLSKKYKNLTAYSSIFPGRPFDENRYSSYVSSKTGVKHKKIQLKCSDYVDFWEKMPEIFSQPVSSHTGVNFYNIMKNSDKKIFYTGYGGDELFGGDIKYFHSCTVDNYSNFLKRKGIDLNISGTALFKSFVSFYDNREELPVADNKSLLSALTEYNLTYWQPEYENFILSSISLYLNKYYVAPYLLRSFCSRVNLLKDEYKINGLITRYIYRKWISKIFSKSFAFRQSQGFSAPLNDYFKNELKEYAACKLKHFIERKNFSKLVNAEIINQKFDELQNGHNTYNYVLSVIIFENFLKKVEENEGSLCIS
ncbi:MAG: asparagine synthase-related protein [Candidatus Muiribacteriota bacterium]